jgi:hypothetical protein
MIVSTRMRRRADIAALVIAFLVGACSNTTSSTLAAQAHSSPLPSGLTLSCTDRYQSSWSMGPLEDGRYVHYLCQNGKVTSWWVDNNSGMEDVPPR